MEYVAIIDLALTVLQKIFVATGEKLPAEVATAVQSAIDALASHKQDVINQANIDSQKG